MTKKANETVLDELLMDQLTKGLKQKTVEDKTQLEMKLIVPKGQVSVKNVYRRIKDPETGEELLEVVPFHILFKEHLTEDITTSNFSGANDNFLLNLIGEQFYCSQMIQKICLMSGHPFKKNSLNLTDAADYFTDLSNTDLSLHKSKDGFGAKLIKSEYGFSSSKQDIQTMEAKPEAKKGWWKFGRK